MLRWLHDVIRREVVDEVPAELDLCFDCDHAACSAEECEACGPRKIRAAAVLAARLTAQAREEMVLVAADEANRAKPPPG